MAEGNILPAEMRAQVVKFDPAALEIMTSIGCAINARDPPPTIYHYTNDVGLRGILESGKLWLTDIFSLNDPSELSHGFSHAISILNDKAAGGDRWISVFA